MRSATDPLTARAGIGEADACFALADERDIARATAGRGTIAFPVPLDLHRLAFGHRGANPTSIGTPSARVALGGAATDARLVWAIVRQRIGLGKRFSHSASPRNAKARIPCNVASVTSRPVIPICPNIHSLRSRCLAS